MKFSHLLMLMNFIYVPAAWSQCAPGIPSAGNPGCIPPSQQNSPYRPQDGTSAPLAPYPAWKDKWGAVALDVQMARAGAIIDKDTERQASDIALDICTRNGGTTCKVIFAFHNQCGAVAQKPQGGEIGYAAAFPQRDAEKQALDKCGNRNTCKVVFSACTMAEQVK